MLSEENPNVAKAIASLQEVPNSKIRIQKTSLGMLTAEELQRVLSDKSVSIEVLTMLAEVKYLASDTYHDVQNNVRLAIISEIIERGEKLTTAAIEKTLKALVICKDRAQFRQFHHDENTIKPGTKIKYCLYELKQTVDTKIMAEYAKDFKAKIIKISKAYIAQNYKKNIKIYLKVILPTLPKLFSADDILKLKAIALHSAEQNIPPLPLEKPNDTISTFGSRRKEDSRAR